MGVIRLGYVHVRVTDLEGSAEHYRNTLGMDQVTENDGRLYLKSWDEHDHHSVVLEAGGVGLVKLGYKVATSADLDVFEQRAAAFGAQVARMSKGDNVGVGDGLRITLPSDHVLELYSEVEYLGNAPGTASRAARPSTSSTPPATATRSSRAATAPGRTSGPSPGRWTGPRRASTTPTASSTRLPQRGHLSRPART